MPMPSTLRLVFGRRASALASGLLAVALCTTALARASSDAAETGGPGAVTALPAGHDEATADRAMAYLARMQAESGAPGVSAAVMVDGRLVFSAGVGMADLQTAMPASARTVHNIGSVSKTIAVVAVMQLVEDGAVDLDAEIQRYAPWFPHKGAPITVRHLLTHTSGIGHYDEIEALRQLPPEARLRHYGSFEESTRAWRDAPLLFEPGSRWHYSSFATNLMQSIVETASGRPFEEYLRENVWKPAGMLSTQFDVPSRIVPGRGRGYARHPETGQLISGEDEDVSYKYAGGGMISSDEDLCRFAHALASGALLKPKALDEMLRPQLRSDLRSWQPPGASPSRAERGPAARQALIWRVGLDAAGRRFIAHSGSVKGTSSYLLSYPAENVVVALHMNYNDGGKDSADAATALASLFLPMARKR